MENKDTTNAAYLKKGEESVSDQQTPKTDEEVIKIFNLYEDKILSNALIGIFKCRRGRGFELLTAYNDTLKEHIRAGTSSMRGKLIVLTGIDGSGKTTQTKLLYEKLAREGHQVETIDYPRYQKTFFGHLVGRYLRGEFGKLKDVSPYLAAALFAGDRFETREMLEGWLNAGKIVLTNRYVADNAAHQGVRFGSLQEIDKFVGWLTHLEHGVYKLPIADINILLSIPPAIAYELIATKTKRDYLGEKKRDIHEEDLSYLDTTSKFFHKLALQPDWKIVECVDDHDNLLGETSVSEKIWECVDKFLKTSATHTENVSAFKPDTHKNNNLEDLKNESIRQQGRTDIDILSPSQLGEIVWLHKSGYSTEAIASRLNVKTWNIDSFINSVERIST